MEAHCFGVSFDVCKCLRSFCVKEGIDIIFLSAKKDAVRLETSFDVVKKHFFDGQTDIEVITTDLRSLGKAHSIVVVIAHKCIYYISYMLKSQCYIIDKHNY